MRKSIVLAVVVLTLAGTIASAAEPIGWWKLNEKEGNNVSDSSGNGFNATVLLDGGPSVWAAGDGFDSNGCAKFAGKQIILIPNGVWGKVKDKMSIAFWVNQDANNAPGDTWPGAFGCAPAEGLKYPDPGWLPLRAFLPSPDQTIDIGKDEAHVYWQPGDANTYSGSWNHYVFVHDANESSMRLYHNGIPVASNFAAMDPMPKINNFIIGGKVYPTGDWFGKIDDFRIYNTVLTDDEVKKLFEAKPGK